MKFTKSKLLSLLFSVVICFTLNFNVFAMDSINTFDNNKYSESLKYENFDINDYDEYKLLLEEYGINLNESIMVIPYSSNNDQDTQFYGFEIPGGKLQIRSRFLSPYKWEMTVLNKGILNMIDMEADVKLINLKRGVIGNMQRRLGPLGKHGSFVESFTDNSFEIDVAIVNLVAITEQGEFCQQYGYQERKQDY